MTQMKLEPSRRRLRAVRGLLPFVLLVLWIASCGQTSSPKAGSETHFLMDCTDTSCGAGMQCICGVCSKPCVQLDDCSELSSAAACTPLGPRVMQGRCDDTQIGAMCDASCLTDGDCSALGPGSRCDLGYCREAEPMLEPASQSCMPSNTAASDVLVLGDVLIELSIYVSELEQRMIAAGSLSDGAHYRVDAQAVSSRLATGPLSFDAQYTSARADGVPRVIIMDGGATDVLNDDCAGMLTPDCPAVRDAVSGAEQLFERFAGDGVEQVVYFFYGDPIDNPSLKDGIDLLRPLLRNACGHSPVPCHWLDLRPVFAEHPEYVGVDGLVLTDSGATAAAQSTFELMQARCIAN
jgi:hypothetical protein